ncbi:MAG: glycosyltransferase family 39 protein [Candidatus Binatia bacterium]|nr:glycosyltransferase family 39 protein [Candidatus Binatia bacterium]
MYDVMVGAAGRNLILSAPVRFVGAFLALLLALWGRFLLADAPNTVTGTVLLVFGCLAAALFTGDRPLFDCPASTQSQRPRPTAALRVLGWMSLVFGMGLFGLATWALVSAWRTNFDWAAPTMVAAVAVSSVGLGMLDRQWRLSEARPRVTALELFAVLAVLAFGTYLRFYRIDYFPPTDGFVAIEEPQSGQGAWTIMSEGVRPWEFMIDRWMPVPFFHWFGISILSLRIPFVIVSCLTLLATYVLLREVVRPPAALLGMFLLSVSHWHLHYARLAHNIFPTTLLSVVVWWLCVRQARTGGLRLYPWIGFWCGYSLYAYAGYRGIPLVVLCFLGGYGLFLFLRRRQGSEATGRWRVYWVGVGLFLLFFAGPVVALVNQLRSNPAYFLEAFYRSYANKQYYVSDWPTWLWLRWQRLVETARIFHHWGDTEQAYNLPGEPMLDPISGVLFTTALFFCLLHPRRVFRGFFVFAFLFLLLAGAMLTQTLVVARLQIVVPLTFILVALWADRFYELATEVGQHWPKAVWTAGSLTAAVAAAILNWEVYFGKIIHSPVMRAVYRNYYTTAITYLHSLPNDAYALLLSDMRNLFIPNDYAWWRGDRIPGDVVTDIYPVLVGAPGPWSGRSLHILIQKPFEQHEVADILRQVFPQAACEWIRHPEGYPHLEQVACMIGRNPHPKSFSTSLRVRYFRPGAQEPFLERAEPAISWALLPAECSRWGRADNPGCVVEWEGEFALLGEGRQEIAVEARNATVDGRIDDRPFALDRSVPIEGFLLGGEMSAARLMLEPGVHRIFMRAVPAAGEGDMGVRLRRKDRELGWQFIVFFTDDSSGSEVQALSRPRNERQSAKAAAE